MILGLLLSVEGRVTVIGLLSFQGFMTQVIYFFVLFYLALFVFCEIVAVVLDNVGPSIRSGLVVPQDSFLLCRAALGDLLE